MRIKRSAVVLGICLLLLGVTACADRGDDDRSDRQTQTETSKRDRSKQKDADKERIVYRVVREEAPNKKEMQEIVRRLTEYASLFSEEIAVLIEDEDQISIEVPKGSAGLKELSALEDMATMYFISQTDTNGNANYTFRFETDTDGNNAASYELTKTLEELKADGSVVLEGTDLKDARATTYQDSMTNMVFAIDITMTEAGAEKFAAATGNAFKKGESIAIYYDGNFLSVPRVQSVITDGHAMISSLGTAEESQRLAALLRVGSLDFGLEKVSP